MFSYTDMKELYPVLHDRVVNDINTLYDEYAFLTPGEILIGAYRLPKEKWLIIFPSNISIVLPILTKSDFTMITEKIRRFLVISKTRWNWFSISPFYKQFHESLMHHKTVSHQELSIKLLFKYIAFNTSNQCNHLSYKSLDHMLTKVLDNIEVIKDLRLSLKNVVLRKTKYSPICVILPDSSIQLAIKT